MNIPLNIDWQQILLHLLNFAILAGGLYLLLYKPVKQFMKKREDYYRDQHQAAEQERADAQALKDGYEEKLKNMEGELEAQRAKAQQELDAYRQEQRKDAQAQAERIVAEAKTAAQREHDKLLAESQQEIQELAIAAAEKLVRQQSADFYDQFLDKAEVGETHA